MSARISIDRLALALLLVGLVMTSAAASGDLTGRWVLVESTYERGSQNLAPALEGHGLECGSSPGGMRIRTWTGADPDALHDWPAVIVGGRALEAEVLTRRIDPSTGVLEATVRIPARRPGDLTLEVGESYRLAEDGEALTGTVTVRMWRDGEPRGGYVLHRRYARSR
jgi:hypothetical protein